MTSARPGYLFGLAAYLLWGAFPLYFPLLQPGGAVEILAHRIVWSCVTMLILVVALGKTRQLRAIARDRRTMLLLTVAATTITINWGTYIFGVNSERVVETSLGYFINPLVTLLLGVVVLGERLRTAQWLAVALGAVACGVLTWDYGRVPWISLALAVSFGTYGLAKKKANVGAIEGLTFETALIGPIALGYVVWLEVSGAGHLGDGGTSHVLLLMSAGIVTAVPLLCFGAAATRIPMTALGLLQYLTPIIQFLIGILIVGEDMPMGRWIGFCLVWLALIVFTADAIRSRRPVRRPANDTR